MKDNPKTYFEAIFDEELKSEILAAIQKREDKMTMMNWLLQNNAVNITETGGWSFMGCQIFYKGIRCIITDSLNFPEITLCPLDCTDNIGAGHGERVDITPNDISK